MSVKYVLFDYFCHVHSQISYSEHISSECTRLWLDPFLYAVLRNEP